MVNSGFQGIRLIETGEYPKLMIPTVESWRVIPDNIKSNNMQCIYEAKPQGEWVAIIRKSNGLVATNGNIPLSIDWPHVHFMLKRENGVLYAVSDGETLVATAVGTVGNLANPLVPGLKKTIIRREGERELTSGEMHEAALRGEDTLADWPEGLATPWILSMGTFGSIHDTTYRQNCVERTNGNGVWLLAVIDGSMRIFEVLS